MRARWDAWLRTVVAAAAVAALAGAARADDEAPVDEGAAMEDGGAAVAASAAPASTDDARALAASADVFVPAPPPPGAGLGPLAPVAAAAPAPRGHRAWGVQLDGGVPDFAALGVLYRPLSWVRLNGSLLHDYAGFGVRAGVAIVPYFPVAPSLNLEVGRLFESNAYARISRHAEIDADLRPVLERFGYTFVNAQVGLEIGHHNAFVFFLRAGVTRMWLTLHGAGAAAQDSIESEDTRVTVSDPDVRLGVPSVKTGFMIFFR